MPIIHYNTNHYESEGAIHYFGPPTTTRIRVTPSVTAASTHLQRTLLRYLS